MYQERIIPIDHGNRNMKTEHEIFTSGLVESETQPPFGNYMIYKGTYYALSEQRIPYQKDKSSDERFFILTLFAIAKELDRQGGVSDKELVNVCLPIGLPPKHFGSLYMKFEEYFRRDGILDFKYRGKTYSICIKDVIAYPQDYAAAMTIYPQIKEYNKVTVIDLGGFTLDYLMLRNGQPDMGICESLDNGVIKLYNEIKSRISSEYDTLLEEMDIDQIIMEKETDYSREVIQTVRNSTRLFTEDFLGSLRERGLDLKSGCVVFVGGGSLLLKDYIRASGKIDKCIFVSELEANARGYGILYRLQQRGR